MFPFARVSFGVPIFDPQPYGESRFIEVPVNHHQDFGLLETLNPRNMVQVLITARSCWVSWLVELGCRSVVGWLVGWLVG